MIITLISSEHHLNFSHPIFIECIFSTIIHLIRLVCSTAGGAAIHLKQELSALDDIRRSFYLHQLLVSRVSFGLRDSALASWGVQGLVNDGRALWCWRQPLATSGACLLSPIGANVVVSRSVVCNAIWPIGLRALSPELAGHRKRLAELERINPLLWDSLIMISSSSGQTFFSGDDIISAIVVVVGVAARFCKTSRPLRLNPFLPLDRARTLFTSIASSRLFRD